MSVRELKKDIYSVGAIDWNRMIFDELIHLPEGTSYNSYLVTGSERTALIDTVYPPRKEELIDNLRKSGVKKIDYIISNHAEQDHSGAIPDILKLFPESRVVTNAKCKGMLVDLLMISGDKFITINDGDTLSLGNKTLEFIFAPWVHWPETMFTYLKEDKVLFTCDFLGSHLATSDLFATDETKVRILAKRYYAEIMMPFRPSIKKHLERIKSLDVKMIGPSHGPVYDNPAFILDAQQEWVADEVNNLVVIPYVSMYGSTEKMVHCLVDALIERGIKVKIFNMTNADVGDLAMSLVDAATVVFASPTVLSGPHPGVVYAAFLTSALRPKFRYASMIGSYSWGGKMVEVIKGLLGNLNAEFIAPVTVKGLPREGDCQSINKLADTIKEKHMAIGAKD